MEQLGSEEEKKTKIPKKQTISRKLLGTVV